MRRNHYMPPQKSFWIRCRRCRPSKTSFDMSCNRYMAPQSSFLTSSSRCCKSPSSLK
jgi:hypothetical protein